MSDGLIFGRAWEGIQAMQQKKAVGRKIDARKTGDYGADPFGNGMFKMVPSGDVVDLAERNRRLTGDYGADPFGNGMFKMVPSGDVVDLAERNRRLVR